MTGWLANSVDSSGFYDYSRWQSSLFGNVGVGWHWTDHWKTELEFGGGTQAETYLSNQVFVNGALNYQTIERESSRRLAGISQQYQFFRNSWFHPHLAAGVNLIWEDRTDHVRPIFAYDPVTRTNRLIELERTDRETHFTAHPFMSAGFKAYMTRRAFFRSDLRLAFHSGIDDTLLRFGFGFDF